MLLSVAIVGAALVSSACTAVPGVPNGYQTVFSTNFVFGLEVFGSEGDVVAPGEGVVMRGQSARITSTDIRVSGYRDLRLGFDRSVSGGTGVVSYSADGGPFQTLESSSNASGRATYPISASSVVKLRFELRGTSQASQYDVGVIVISGDPVDGGGTPAPNPGPVANPNQTPDASWANCNAPINPNAPMLANNYGYNLWNTRNQESPINSSNVANLRVKYAHVTPGVETKRGAPAVTQQTVFYYSGSVLKAANLEIGCEYWSYRANNPFKSSSIVLVPELNIVFAGDDGGGLHAVNATTGRPVWTTNVGTNPEGHMITGGMQYHNGVVYVPVASREVIKRISSPCCTTHGMLRAYDARTGAEKWTYHTTPEARRSGFRQGPSGASVWSTPTIDPSSNTLYLGTGQNFSQPATQTSDAIIALDLTTGQEKWVFQARAGDVWNAYTSAALTGSDYDFGASPIVVNDGRTIIAGDKAGFVYSLDAATGRVNWSKRIGTGGKLGGIHWNMAVDDDRVYVGVADVTSNKVNESISIDRNARPGVYALRISDGTLVWEAHPTHRSRGREYPSLYSAGLSVTNDVVFAASLDGTVRAFRSSNGQELWNFNSAVPVTGVDGSRGNGGTVDSIGPVVAGKHLLLNSGYNVFGGTNSYQAGPGNALFVLSLP